MPEIVEGWEVWISFQLRLLVWQIIGPLCLDWEKLQDTGREESNLQAAAERRQQGPRIGEACA